MVADKPMKMLKTTQNEFFGVLFSLVSIALAKIMNPNGVHIHRILQSIFAKQEAKIDPEQFATAVLRRNKEVFERLAEM